MHFSMCQMIHIGMGKEWFSYCHAHSILINARSHSHHQMTLEDVITRELKSPPFTNVGLLDYIIKLVICEDEVCETLARHMHSFLDNHGILPPVFLIV